MALVPACSRAYYVRTDHLQYAEHLAAQTGRPVAMPALDESGRETCLEHESIRVVESVDPMTGLARVRVRDGRTGATATGTALLVAGAVVVSASLGPGHPCKGCIPNGSVREFGASMAVAGFAVLLAGLLSDGAEEDAPTPGMPRSFADPAPAP